MGPAARAHLARPGPRRERHSARGRPAGRYLLGAMALSRLHLPPVCSRLTPPRGSSRLLYRNLRLLLVASLAPRATPALAAVPSDSPQPAAHRGHHLLLQAPGRDDREFADRQRARLHNPRPVARG